MRRILPLALAGVLVGAVVTVVGVSNAAGPDPAPRTKTGYSECTTDTNGKCSVTHGLGVTPDAVLVTPVIQDPATSYMLNVVLGSVTPSQFTVKARSATNTPEKNRLVRMYWEVTAPTAAPPTTSTKPTTSTPSTSTSAPTSSTTPTPTTTTTPPPAAGTLADRYKAWSNGPNPTGSTAVYPVAVWMQGAERHPPGDDTPNAETYEAIGVPQNLAMPDWPAGSDRPWVQWRMDESVSAGWHEMPWVSAAARSQVSANADVAKVVTGYTLGDEADQNKPNGNAADKPTNYLTAGQAAKTADPTRPVYSNFGGAFANRYWSGYSPEPGTGTAQERYDRDMRQYCDSSDIVSADIYAYTNGWLGGQSDPRRQAWYYGQTIDNLKYYCGADKIAYGFVETGHPFGEFSWDDPQYWITPQQMENAVWNLVVHGADGIEYFAHDFGAPSGELIDDGMLRHPDIKAKAQALNARLQELAPALNAVSVPGVSVAATGSVPVTFMHKIVGGAHYVLAQADGNLSVPASGATTATFTVPVSSGTATVVGEGRTVPIVNGKIVDQFAAYGFHAYKF